jgi:alpha-galactosidase
MDRTPRTWSFAPLILALLTPCCSAPSSDPTPSSPPTTSTPPPVTATSGDAFVSSDPKAQTWTIGNSGIHVTFGFTPSQDFVLEQILDPQSGQGLNSVAAVDASITVNGTTVALGSASAGWNLSSTAASTTASGGVQLAFTFGSAKVPLLVVRYYACYPGSPTIEAWTTFQATAGTPVTVSNPNAWQLTVPATTVHYVTGLQGDNAGNAVNSAFTFQTSTLNAGDQMTLGAQGRSSELFIPAITADTAIGDEFFGGLLWSGAWQIGVQGLASQVSLTAGLPAMDITVDSTYSLEVPHAFFGITPGGPNQVSQALHTYLAQAVRQGQPLQPLVTYNTWFVYGTSLNETLMENEMTAAAAVGVELFVMDAGWYLGAGANGVTDFTSGLGNFTADPARFPSGLPALVNYAHGLGLKFGLWVEPERTALANVGLPGLAQEAWLATSNGSYDPNTPAGQQVAALLCLRDPDAQTWLLGQLTTLLDQVQPDYLKWDNNFWINCDRAGHGHGPTDGNHAHVEGLYSILAALRSRYPGMLIENVSGGGNRLDFGMLRYTDTAWMDDNSRPAEHVRHNLEGLTTFFPPGYLLSFVEDKAPEPLVNPPDLPLFTRSRMPGILGLTYLADRLTDTALAALSQEIGIYKTFRATVTTASGMLLTPQTLPTNGPGWDSLEELDAVSGNVIIFAFQNDRSAASVTVLPVGLQAGAAYNVFTADGTSIGGANGSDLLTNGIAIVSSPASAAHVLLLQPVNQSSTSARRSLAARPSGAPSVPAVPFRRR